MKKRICLVIVLVLSLMISVSLAERWLTELEGLSGLLDAVEDPVGTAMNKLNPDEETVQVTLASGRTANIRKSVKEFVDHYEEIYAKYMDKTNISSAEYMTVSMEYLQLVEQLEAIQGDLTNDETFYYAEMNQRLLKKIK